MIALAWLALAAHAGGLQGTVVDPDGHPVENATVVVYDRRLNYEYMNTGSDGAWQFDGLADGPWRIRVIPSPTQPWIEQWAQGTLQVCQSQTYTVGSDPVPPVVISLVAGGSLSGILLDTSGAPVPGALVSAKPVSAPAIFLRADSTDAEGHFQVQGLAPDDGGTGTYRLEVSAPGWPVQSLGGAYVPQDAETFTVSLGSSQDIGTRTLLDGIAVSGSAVGPDGPVPDGEIRVSSGSQTADGTIVDGTWAVSGLPPGDVLAWARSDGYATTWWPNADRPSQRIPVDDEGQTRDGVAIQLPFESILRGHLTGDGPVGGLNVLAYNDDQTVAVGALSDPDGSFRVRSLSAGRYTLYVYGARAGFVDDFVRDVTGTPKVYSVPAQGTSDDFPVALPKGATLSGVVTDAQTGAPVYGASVHTVRQETGESKVAVTAPNGTWALAGLRAGTWELWATYQPYCGTDASWVPLYYPDQVNPALVGLVRLAPGDSVRWNPALAEDNDQDGMSDAWEVAHGLDPTRNDAGEDPDGDGFTNYQEYLLGTDPMVNVSSNGSCAGCQGSGAWLWMFPLWPWWWRRRRTAADG